MTSVDALEAFTEKWKPSVRTFQRTIQDAVEKAGYGYDGYEMEFNLDDEAPVAQWFMYVWQPGRPEDLDYLDMSLYLTLISHDPEHDLYTPILEIMNNDGSIADDVKLSVPLRLDDDAAWAKVWGDGEPLAKDIVDFVEDYNPKPSKRIWRIRGTLPKNVPIHPSIHTNKDVAKSEIAQRLSRILELASKVVWELQATNKYTGPAGSSTNLALARRNLEQGKPIAALRNYHGFLATLEGPLLDLINRNAGTLDVVMAGGFPGEDEDE